MCKAIFRFYQITGKKVGLKVAGGVRTVPDVCYLFPKRTKENRFKALNYRLVVENVLGSEWLTPELVNFPILCLLILIKLSFELELPICWTILLKL